MVHLDGGTAGGDSSDEEEEEEDDDDDFDDDLDDKDEEREEEPEDEGQDEVRVPFELLFNQSVEIQYGKKHVKHAGGRDILLLYCSCQSNFF